MMKDQSPAIRLLLVEDQPDLRKMLTRVLDVQGYDCLSAATVADGMDLLREANERGAPPHLLLSDLSLPDGDGLSFAHEAKGLVPGLKVAFMSGYESLQASGFNNGIAANLPLLKKPFTMEALTEFINGCMACEGDAPSVI